MFRCSVLLCLFMLLYSTTSSPYKSWEREKVAAVQDTRYHDYDEKMVLGHKEVEPVEEQDLTEFDIDPHMAIWKAMKQFRQQKNLETKNERQVRLYEEDEKDMYDVYNNGLVNHGENKVRVFQPEIPVSDKAEAVKLHKASAYLTPEEDKDGLYHGDFEVQVFQVPVNFAEDSFINVYSEPEEDQDHLFHS